MVELRQANHAAKWIKIDVGVGQDEVKAAGEKSGGDRVPVPNGGPAVGPLADEGIRPVQSGSQVRKRK
jgi:hypothetical protein